MAKTDHFKTILCNNSNENKDLKQSFFKTQCFKIIDILKRFFT